MKWVNHIGSELTRLLPSCHLDTVMITSDSNFSVLCEVPAGEMTRVACDECVQDQIGESLLKLKKSRTSKEKERRTDAPLESVPKRKLEVVIEVAIAIVCCTIVIVQLGNRIVANAERELCDFSGSHV